MKVHLSNPDMRRARLKKCIEMKGLITAIEAHSGITGLIPEFCDKIAAGKRAQKTNDFMNCARIESLILEQGMDDALERAFCIKLYANMKRRK